MNFGDLVEVQSISGSGYQRIIIYHEGDSCRYCQKTEHVDSKVTLLCLHSRLHTLNDVHFAIVIKPNVWCLFESTTSRVRMHKLLIDSTVGFVDEDCVRKVK